MLVLGLFQIKKNYNALCLEFNNNNIINCKCSKCTTFGQLFITKVNQIYALILAQNAPKMRLAAGLRPDPLGEHWELITQRGG